MVPYNRNVLFLTSMDQRRRPAPSRNIYGSFGGGLRLSPWLTQTVKTMFAVRCEILDRQDHFIAF